MATPSCSILEGNVYHYSSKFIPDVVALNLTAVCVKARGFNATDRACSFDNRRACVQSKQLNQKNAPDTRRSGDGSSTIPWSTFACIHLYRDPHAQPPSPQALHGRVWAVQLPSTQALLRSACVQTTTILTTVDAAAISASALDALLPMFALAGVLDHPHMAAPVCNVSLTAAVPANEGTSTARRVSGHRTVLSQPLSSTAPILSLGLTRFKRLPCCLAPTSNSCLPLCGSIGVCVHVRRYCTHSWCMLDCSSEGSASSHTNKQVRRKQIHSIINCHLLHCTNC